MESGGAVVACGRVFSPELLKRIGEAVRQHPEWSRSRIAREVCQWLNLCGPNGKLREMSCRKALLRLHRQGRIQLPQARREIRFEGRSTEGVKLDAPGRLVCELEQIKQIELVLVGPGQRALSAQWNTLVSRHHELGYQPLAGAQLRYLVRTEHGYVAALGFRSAARALAARDRFIGWGEQSRQAFISQVVCQARFAIVRGVKVKNLASRVLALASERLAQDWAAVYGMRPVLVETYVDTTRHTGSCYRAANWQYVGQTRGGRSEPLRRSRPKSRKAVFVYPLCADFRQRLCERPGPARMSEAARLEQRASLVGLGHEDWAEWEFREARLGDRRRSQRLCTVARAFFEQPQAAIPQACGSTAASKAAYRLFKRVSMEEILVPHYDATLERVAQHGSGVVLAVNDSTSLSFTNHPQTDGLGPLNNKKDKAVGLWMHSTMVYDTAGVAQGLIDAQVWARPAVGKATQRHRLPIEAKESVKWIKSYASAARLQRQLGSQTRVVCVGDREADIYELFARAARDPKGPALLVRADCGERMLAEGECKVRDHLASLPVAGRRVVQIPRHKGQPARQAELEMRFARVELRAPHKSKRLGVVGLWTVYVTEPNPPAGIKPIEWMLWSMVEVTTAEQAWEKVEWYRERWRIEEFHRTLKSGCRIEDRQLTDAQSIKSCLAVDLVVAWRVEHIKKLARQQPERACTDLFTQDEIEVLLAKFAPPMLASGAIPSLRDAVRWTARLGGFLARRSDGEPGSITIWRGLERLNTMTTGWVLARHHERAHTLPSKPTVFGHGEYG